MTGQHRHDDEDDKVEYLVTESGQVSYVAGLEERRHRARVWLGWHVVSLTLMSFGLAVLLGYHHVSWWVTAVVYVALAVAIGNSGMLGMAMGRIATLEALSRGKIEIHTYPPDDEEER